VQIEDREDNADSFAIVAIETVSAYDVRRVAARCAVVEGRNRTRVRVIGADQIQTAIYAGHAMNTKAFTLLIKEPYRSVLLLTVERHQPTSVAPMLKPY